MDKDKQLDWQQFEEQLTSGKSINDLLGLTESSKTNCDDSMKVMSNSQSSMCFENLKITMPGSMKPLKFVYPVSSYVNVEKQPGKQDDLLVAWPVLSLERVIPECWSPEAEQLIQKELGIKVMDGNK